MITLPSTLVLTPSKPRQRLALRTYGSPRYGARDGSRLGPKRK